MLVFAEGRVEHQKQNQTATSQWPVGFVFGVQLDYSCRKKSDPANAETRVDNNKMKRLSIEPHWVQRVDSPRERMHFQDFKTAAP